MSDKVFINRRLPRKATPQKKRRHYLLIGIIAAGLIVLLIPTVIVVRIVTEDKDVKAIRDLIYRTRQAVIDKDIKTCLSALDEKYEDNMHNTYEKIQAEAKKNPNLADVSSIKIRLRNMKIDVAENKLRAWANFEMRFTAWVREGGRNVPVLGLVSEINPLAQTWEKVSLRGEKRDGRWLLVHAEIQPASRK